MSYAEYLAEDRRLALLRLLEGLESRAANSSVLHRGLERLGHYELRAAVEADLAWLQEGGLVRLEEVDLAAGVVIATITERGVLVAAGRAVAQGVKRPLPR